MPGTQNRRRAVDERRRLKGDLFALRTTSEYAVVFESQAIPTIVGETNEHVDGRAVHRNAIAVSQFIEKVTSRPLNVLRVRDLSRDEETGVAYRFPTGNSPRIPIAVAETLVVVAFSSDHVGSLRDQETVQQLESVLGEGDQSLKGFGSFQVPHLPI